MEPSPEAAEATAVTTLPIGRSGRLEAAELTASGDHALLVRETGAGGRRRVLLTTDKLPSGERLVVMPLDDEVEVRVDGDALAVWLGAGSIQTLPPQHQALSSEPAPFWATVVGGGLLLLLVAFAVIGSAYVFSLLVALLT